MQFFRKEKSKDSVIQNCSKWLKFGHKIIILFPVTNQCVLMKFVNKINVNNMPLVFERMKINICEEECNYILFFIIIFTQKYWDCIVYFNSKRSLYTDTCEWCIAQWFERAASSMGLVSSNPGACTWSRRPNFVRKGGFLVVEKVLRPYRWPRHCWALNPQNNKKQRILIRNLPTSTTVQKTTEIRLCTFMHKGARTLAKTLLKRD